MNRTIRKLKCALGMHEYKDSNLKSICIADDYYALTYRMSNKCVYCGKEYSETVVMPYRTR